MKKILLSCACCLLALGLVTACNNEEEEPNEPEVPGTVVDDGGSDSGLETVKTGKLGLLQESLYSYYYFTGEVNSSGFGVGTADFSEAADVTLSKEGTDYYLAVSVDGGTKYIGCPDTSKSAMALYDEPVALTYNEEYDAIVTGDGEEFLCTFGSYTTFSWSSVKTYLGKEGEYIAHIYSSAQTNPTAPELPDPAEWQVGESYLFGVNLTSEIQYIDGGTVSGRDYEGTLTSNASKAVHVTVGEVEGEDDAYTLSFELSSVTYYITIITTGEGEDAHTNLSYSTEEALIYWNETYGCWGNEEETHFLCYNSSYKCLYCSEIETWISSSPIAALYEITVLPAPTEMSITGPDIVYVGYTAQLAVEVDEGADASVTWSIAAADGSATEAATIDEETGLVHGVSEVEGLVVTATSAVEECDVSATATIDVLPIVNPNVGTDNTYKLGAKDETNYEYRWFTGSTTGSTFLATSTSYSDGVDVYITSQAAQDDTSDTSCTLSFVDSENQLKYICNNNSATSVTIEDNPCIWVYDETNGVFAMGTNLNTSGGDRFLCYYASTPSFRAYAGTTSNLNNYPHVTAYTSEPDAMEKPEPAYDMTLVTNLESGSEYYLAYFNESTGTYYFFDGGKVGSNDYYLSCSTDIDSAAKVTVTSADSDKWTLTFGETGSTKTLEGWLNTASGTHAEITYIESGSSDTHSGVTSFNWNSTYSTVTITLSSTEYYLEYNQYNGTDEIQLNGISYIASTGKAFQLFTLNESEPS